MVGLRPARYLFQLRKSCLYCGATLPATKKEHIFNSCWGGSFSTNKLICGKCNEYFSQTIDSELTTYTKFVMNSWGIKGERHKQIPEIVTDGEYNIRAYAKPKLKTENCSVKASSDGSLEFNFSCSSKEEVYKWLNSDKPETDLGRTLTAEERQWIKQRIQEAKLEKINVEPQPLFINLNLSKQYRSVAHTLLKCLGLYDPDLVRGDMTRKVREFIRYEQGNWEEFAVTVNQLIPSVKDRLSQKLGVNYNSVEIYWCCSLEKIIGVLTLLGRIQRAVILAENCKVPNAILAVVEDTYLTRQIPKSFFLELEQQIADIPLIEILFSPPKIEFFRKEISHIASVSLPFEGLNAFLAESIYKIGEQTQELTLKSLQEYEKLFLDFVSNLEKLFGISVEPKVVSSQLAVNGFSDLVQYHIGKNFKEHPEVQDTLLTACTKTWEELTNQLQMKIEREIPE
ncbi:hypothetical protein H6G97_47155 [Nostoc flagelliforme FACHB-838]|uniref:HNH endonuclease 5 domain-containing protein n=2 Tax=Nostoc flagelliforme TaxID=1306274 RepID=A0ABR8E799_9NOSO|nr:hypothetical protein [Nostoc flagelliforme FACHB-838]